jgi:hypothetical protein
VAKSIKIYVLYKLDGFGRPKFVGRFASRHRMMAAMVEDTHYFYETDEKSDEFGGTINVSEELDKHGGS